MRCFQEKTLLNPLDNKEIKSINPKGNQGDEMVRKITDSMDMNLSKLREI